MHHVVTPYSIVVVTPVKREVADARHVEAGEIFDLVAEKTLVGALLENRSPIGIGGLRDLVK